MKAVTDLPRPVHEVEHLTVAMSDGTRLAARMWLPQDAESDPVPALLEMHPYGKDKGGAEFRYLAGHGYAMVRVDARGGGSSDGILEDEYAPSELQDGQELIAWIARQPWCSGKVGLRGISWSSSNALLLAATRPPALGAIVACCGGDERYSDDVHYLDGCLVKQNLEWATSMLVYNSCSPDPRRVGERWRELWLERLERTPSYAEAWMSHPRWDDYWRQSAISHDYAAVEVPTYLVGGWADVYRRAVLRTLAGLRCPRRALVGPWEHTFPHEAKAPGPPIGWLQEEVRWFDHWLKGAENGAMDGPLLRAYVQEPLTPEAVGGPRAGRWVGEDAWPSEHVRDERLALGADGSLAGRGENPAHPPPAAALAHRGSAATGVNSSPWRPGGDADARADDGRSLCFTTPPLPERIELLGTPRLDLEVSVDRPLALVAMRLCSIAPDGFEEELSLGVLNLAMRAGREQREALEPGRRYRVRVEGLAIGQAVPAGHRLRLALSSTHFWVWPSPEPVTLTVHVGGKDGSALLLPVRPPRAQDDALEPFGEPETAELDTSATLFLGRVQEPGRVVSHDVEAGTYELRCVWGNHGSRAGTEGILADIHAEDVQRVVEDDPLATSHRMRVRFSQQRGDWRVRVEVEQLMSSTAEEFVLSTAVDAYEGEQRVLARRRELRTPRDHL